MHSTERLNPDAESTDSVVELLGISKSYEEAGRPRPILSDVTASFPAGSCTAILGRSGSGKSTLLNLIAGLDTLDKGVIRVAGTPVNLLSERDRTLFRRLNIGFVFQFFNLIATLTVLENVRLPLDLAGEAPDTTKDTTGVALRLLESVGLADRQDTFPDRLSGGEQQRVAIARALAADPMLVLADEPTGNLDADTGRQVVELLLALTRERNRALVVATHSRALAGVADHVLRIDHGGLIELPASGLGRGARTGSAGAT